MEQDLLTTEQVAAVICVTAATLRYWRHRNDGSGPRSFTLGRRKVMYRRRDVDAWLEAQYNKPEGMAS